jgi:fermentation-respiration switch protein FrsA (DUF1100 family)
MYLQFFAVEFCKAGFVVMVFDYCFLGGSEGELRQQIIPFYQHQDYRNAISWVQTQPEVDANQIGLWGSSYSGAHVLHLAAFDKRVKAVVSNVPLTDGFNNGRRLMRSDHFEDFRSAIIADRQARQAGGPVNYVPVVGLPGEPCVLPTDDCYPWFMQTHKDLAPAWENRVTMESLEGFLEYRPMASVDLISPTPLLMIVAAEDRVVPADISIATFSKAHEPKALQMLPGGHFGAYNPGPVFDLASGAAANWFKKHLPY